MPVLIAKNWWSLLIRGAASITAGILAVLCGGVGTGDLQLFFGFYVMLDGLVALAGAMRAAEEHERWTSLLLEALASIAAGLITFGWPVMTSPAIFSVIAAWALATGILEISAARRLRNHIFGEWLLASSGVASLLLGLLLIVAPFAGRPPETYWVGAYGVVFGALLVRLGIRIRQWNEAAYGSPAVSPSGM